MPDPVKMRLKSIRKKLKSKMTELSDGYVFIFYSLWDDTLQPSCQPSVTVRVELKLIDFDRRLFGFGVNLDFHFGVGMTVADTEKLKQVMNKAIRKAKWAEKVVSGFECSFEQLSKLDGGE